ncbi:MAG: diguanylate cyclase, partial [Parasphingorhabdus sp.]
MRNEERLQFEGEVARQFALERYDVLDTEEESSFDHITKAVKLALDVPIAAISMVDGNRQWFKSKVGLDVSETPRSSAFCGHTISQAGAMVVEDSSQDSRFKDNPLVTGSPFIKSYVGVPLTTPDGHNIGALCAIDTVPRKFEPTKIELLGQLAELVIHELELRQQAAKDRLTGALTRSGFSVEVQKAISLFDRQKVKSTLILFNVDLYRMVNSSAGSSSGNALLKTIIQSLVKRLRPSDCVGRLGGTQFAVLLTGATQAKASFATEEFLKRTEQTNAGVFFNVSFSEISPEIGISED